jgi:hypothetical protein
MIGTNTTALAQNSFQEGRKEGINDVLTRLAELMSDETRLSAEECKALKRAYNILDEEFPC